MRTVCLTFALVAACSAGFATARIGGGRSKRASVGGFDGLVTTDGERAAQCQHTGTWLRESALLAGEQEECGGRETYGGRVTFDQCARACDAQSAFFIHGRADSTRCDGNERCACFCEVMAPVGEAWRCTGRRVIRHRYYNRYRNACAYEREHAGGDTSEVEPTPEPTPMATPEETPMATPEETPMATPEETPMATPEETPMATPEETPMATPEPTPMATPEATPEATNDFANDEDPLSNVTPPPTYMEPTYMDHDPTFVADDFTDGDPTPPPTYMDHQDPTFVADDFPEGPDPNAGLNGNGGAGALLEAVLAPVLARIEVLEQDLLDRMDLLERNQEAGGCHGDERGRGHDERGDEREGSSLPPCERLSREWNGSWELPEKCHCGGRVNDLNNECDAGQFCGGDGNCHAIAGEHP